jgi:hypothetical protein
MMVFTSRTSRISFARRLAGLVLASAAATPAMAQAHHPGAAQHPCAPRLTAQGATFFFGNEGGNLKRSGIRLWANGSVQVGSGRHTAPDPALADSVAALAGFARRSAFWTTTARPITKPTRNPDMARHFVEARLRCGTKSALYAADNEPAAFHELFARLTGITKGATQR